MIIDAPRWIILNASPRQDATEFAPVALRGDQVLALFPVGELTAVVHTIPTIKTSALRSTQVTLGHGVMFTPTPFDELVGRAFSQTEAEEGEE